MAEYIGQTNISATEIGNHLRVIVSFRNVFFY